METPFKTIASPRGSVFVGGFTVADFNAFCLVGQPGRRGVPMPGRFLCGAVTLWIALAGFAMMQVRVQEPTAVTVNVFPGGFNWPSFVAQEKGFFERNGIRVTLQATPNSVAQMTGLAEGRFDIAITAVDNIIAYVEGQGEAPIGPQPEFFAFLGSDSSFLNLVVAPDI